MKKKIARRMLVPLVSTGSAWLARTAVDRALDARWPRKNRKAKKKRMGATSTVLLSAATAAVCAAVCAAAQTLAERRL